MKKIPVTLQKIAEKYNLTIKADKRGYLVLNLIRSERLVIRQNGKRIIPANTEYYILFELNFWLDRISNYKKVYSVHNYTDSKNHINSFQSLINTVKQIDTLLSKYSKDELYNQKSGFITY